MLYGIGRLSFTLIFTWTLEKNNSLEECHVRNTSSNLDTYTLVSILAILVGGMIGWMARQHSYETTPQVVYTHPEMFDANGQLVPDEILALRIETHDNTDDEDDD